MVRPVVSEDFLVRCAPRGCTAVVGVFQADHVIYVYKGAGLIGVEAYGGAWLVALIVEICTIVAACIGCKGYKQQGYGQPQFLNHINHSLCSLTRSIGLLGLGLGLFVAASSQA